jgi:hypothetical protein
MIHGRRRDAVVWMETMQKGDSTRNVRDDMLTYGRGYTTKRWANIDLDKKAVRISTRRAPAGSRSSTAMALRFGSSNDDGNSIYMPKRVTRMKLGKAGIRQWRRGFFVTAAGIRSFRAWRN